MSGTEIIFLGSVLAILAAAGFLLWRRGRGSQSDVIHATDNSPRPPGEVGLKGPPLPAITIELGPASARLVENLTAAVSALNARPAQGGRMAEQAVASLASLETRIPPPPDLSGIEASLERLATAWTEGLRAVAQALPAAEDGRPVEGPGRGENRNPRPPSVPTRDKEGEAARPREAALAASAVETKVVRKVNEWIERGGDADLPAIEQITGMPLVAVAFKQDDVLTVTGTARENPRSDLLGWVAQDRSLRFFIGYSIINDYNLQVASGPNLLPTLRKAFRKDTGSRRRGIVACGTAQPLDKPQDGFALSDLGVLAPWSDLES
jgi:hypothetical protein